jgi:hypothetical protein
MSDKLVEVARRPFGLDRHTSFFFKQEKQAKKAEAQT